MRFWFCSVAMDQTLTSWSKCYVLTVRCFFVMWNCTFNVMNLCFRWCIKQTWESSSCLPQHSCREFPYGTENWEPAVTNTALSTANILAIVTLEHQSRIGRCHLTAWIRKEIKHNLFINLTFMGPCIVKIFQYISNKMQRYIVYFVWKLFYMFRMVPPLIIRSANNCIYSIWYLSHLYCYLPLYIQQNATLHSLFYLKTALHVPAGTPPIIRSAKTVPTASGICQTVTATCRYSGREQ